MMQYLAITDSRSEALAVAERARYVGRMAHHLRQASPPLDDNSYISNQAFEGEYTLDQYADNMVVGDPHTVAEKMVADIKRLNPSNYTCNFSFGCMPIELVTTSRERVDCPSCPAAAPPRTNKVRNKRARIGVCMNLFNPRLE